MRASPVRPSPDDLIAVIETCIETLEPAADADWSRLAGALDWSCRRTLEHLCALAYGQQLATRATSYRSTALTIEGDAPIRQLLWTVEVLGRMLAEVARAAPPTARAFHPAGMADPSGFVAMEMDELLVHTHDIAVGLGIDHRPDDDLVRPVLDRLFPWWPDEIEPWPALLWANGRQPLPDRESPGQGWLWHCAPLEEWDGTVPTWDPEAGRPAGGGERAARGAATSGR